MVLSHRISVATSHYQTKYENRKYFKAKQNENKIVNRQTSVAIWTGETTRGPWNYEVEAPASASPS